MTPTLVRTIAELRRLVAAARVRGASIGLVPTMGALHRGHAALMRRAREETGLVVVSIFVNPTQFGPHEDLARYPRMLEQDCELCGRERVDVVFAPPVEEMYPAGFRTFVEVEGLQNVLCGASRPGHFRGVCTVVLKLFNQVQPERAYFGQKDAQQARILQQMVRDLDVPVEMCICPTVREPDGLALSSRNQYLDAGQRQHALSLYQTLQHAQHQIAGGERSAAVIRQRMEERLVATPGAVVDYAAVVDADSLQPLASLRGRVLLALAVKFGATRLIDNALVDVPE